MKKENSKIEYKINEIIDVFQSTIRDIESLNEFYYRSNKTLVEYRCSNEKNYLPGKKIGELFDQILELKGIDEKNERINEINNVEIIPSIKVSDVFSIATFSDEKEPLRFSVKDKFKSNPYFLPSEAVVK